MYENSTHSAPNILSPGYIRISKETGLSVESSRKIKGHLERLEIIVTHGKSSYILKTYDESLRILGIKIE